MRRRRRGGVHMKLEPNMRSFKRWSTHHKRNHFPTEPQCTQKRNLFKTQKPLKKSQHTTLHAPSAPLNTTSYIIKAKENQVISTIDEFPYSPVLDSYGSMKGLLGLDLSSGEEICEFEQLNESSADSDKESDGLVYSPSESSDSRIMPKMLSLRIRNQDNQIAHLEEDSAMLKERMVFMEQELDFLKHRVRILELGNAMRMVGVCSCQASFA